MDADVAPLFTSAEDLCWDSVICGRRLFNCQEGKQAPEFYESLKLKLNLKVNHEYSNAK